MNKTIVVIRTLIIITFSLFFTNSELSAHINRMSEAGYSSGYNHVSDKLIISRLANLSGVIDINFTPEVGRRIREYTVRYRVAGERILGRVDLFFPLFEQEIYKRNLPDELKYIAVVESNLDPTAYSAAGAAGLWQFVKSTGKMQGLKIDYYVDERKDPVKSTIAAMDYLSFLYDEFDDWTLAIAAYNCGPGNVRKAIRKGGSRDYWDIRFFLPIETQKYVPRIIAAMYLMQYYHTHDLVPAYPENDFKNLVKVNDGKEHDLRKLSEELEVPYEFLRELNPHFRTHILPENDGSIALNLPKNVYEKYLELHDRETFGELLRKRKENELKMQKLQRVKEIRGTRIERPEKLINLLRKELNSINRRRDIELRSSSMISE